MLRLIFATIIIISFSNCKSINQRKDTATTQLNNLKNGVLLVRLPTNIAKIEKLEQLGEKEEAKKVKTFLNQFHQDVFRAFENSFDYSKVYFYYSDASRAVRSGDFNGNLIDSKQFEINNLPFNSEQIFYAEFGKVHQNEVTQEKNGQKVKVAGFGGRDALVIRTKEGLQPPRPFPYSVDYTSPFHAHLSNAIKTLNQRLYTAYNKMEGRKLRRKRRGK